MNPISTRRALVVASIAAAAAAVAVPQLATARRASSWRSKRSEAMDTNTIFFD
jgi:putative intracellular protease/amidase